MKVLITGGAGFIGSAFIRYLITERPDIEIVNVDKLTYAGNLENLVAVEGDARYVFVRADLCDRTAISQLVADAQPNAIVHFAAESHVDRSILSPALAIETNVCGTANLLAAASACRVGRFLHVSTDEVYGDIDEPAEADESFPLRPSSPYAASKAASDLLVLAYKRTYGLPVVVTRASNNYGPHQFPEKLIPLVISRAIEGLPVPMYGDGLQVRDWLFVDDHCRALLAVLQRGRDGEVYNIGGNCSLTNAEVITRILAALQTSRELIQRVTDRPGHDRRYALNADKLAREVGFEPTTPFEVGLDRTIAWYRHNFRWMDNVKSGAYRDYYQKNYGWRIGIDRAGLETVG